MKRLLPFVLIPSIAACGGVDEVEPDATPYWDAAAPDAARGTPDAAEEITDAGDIVDGSITFGDQMISRDCGPDDGPAVRITLAEDISLMCRPDGFGASLEIYVWVSPITAPQTISFGPEQQNGSATLCLGGLAPCLIATSGTIELDGFTQGVGANGSFSIVFGDGTETGTFDADWCNPPTPILCG